MTRVEQAVQDDTQATTDSINRNGDKQAQAVRLQTERLVA